MDDDGQGTTYPGSPHARPTRLGEEFPMAPLPSREEQMAKMARVRGEVRNMPRVENEQTRPSPIVGETSAPRRRENNPPSRLKLIENLVVMNGDRAVGAWSALERIAQRLGVEYEEIHENAPITSPPAGALANLLALEQHTAMWLQRIQLILAAIEEEL